MLSYQDFEKAKNGSPEEMTQFIRRAVQEHESSKEYDMAVTARAYYEGENVTIRGHRHLITDGQGNTFEDIWTPNHKVMSQFIKRAVDQRVSFLLANGAIFNNPSTKDRLGTPKDLFDTRVMEAMMESTITGLSYSFWNVDHIQVFTREAFKPLPDRMDGSLRAGIYTWRLDDENPRVFYVFDFDGYSKYWENPDTRQIELVDPFRKYRLKSIRNGISEEIHDGEPYPGFPIVPLYFNKAGTPLIHGLRGTIDGLDTARSTQMNNVDTNILLHIFEGFEGMDGFDIVQKIAELRRMQGIALPPMGSADSAHYHAEALSPPYEGINTAIEELKNTLASDSSVFDPQLITASSDTATAIRAAYDPLYITTNIFDTMQFQPYVHRILQLAGIEGEEVTLKRDAITNVLEQLQALMMIAPYVDDQYIREAGMTLLGDADKIEAVTKRMMEQEAERIQATENAPPQGEDENAEETEVPGNVE